METTLFELAAGVIGLILVFGLFGDVIFAVLRLLGIIDLSPRSPRLSSARPQLVARVLLVVIWGSVAAFFAYFCYWYYVLGAPTR